ncbi:hypothetical protein AB0B83_14705 [Micromonospora sp. NPDC049060]
MRFLAALLGAILILVTASPADAAPTRPAGGVHHGADDRPAA